MDLNMHLARARAARDPVKLRMTAKKNLAGVVRTGRPINPNSLRQLKLKQSSK